MTNYDVKRIVEQLLRRNERYDWSERALNSTRWKVEWAGDEWPEEERKWITDIFTQTTDRGTEEYDRHLSVQKRRRSRLERNSEDLRVGDTTELDSFLAGFSMK